MSVINAAAAVTRVSNAPSPIARNTGRSDSGIGSSSPATAPSSAAVSRARQLVTRLQARSVSPGE